MGFLSKLFGEPKKDPLKQAFEGIYRFIEDEEHQNSLLPAPLAEVIKSGVSCDVIPGAKGEFGFEATNPIPVNGALGELSYLSRLESAQGERLLFHRIGAVDKIDVFEAVTYSGSSWFVFFMDMYHPRRSRRAPDGFAIAKEPRQFSGFHNHCANFPYDFVEAKQATPDGLRVAYIPLSNVVNQIGKQAFNRPLGHKAKLDLVRSQLTSGLMHHDARADKGSSPSTPMTASPTGDESFDHVVVDLHNKFRGWAQVPDISDVTAKVMQRQLIYEISRAYAFALFVLRGLKNDSRYLSTNEFVALLTQTQQKLVAQRLKAAEAIFGPMKLPGLRVEADAAKISAEINRELADAVSCAEACANRLRTDGKYDDQRLVRFFVSKAPLLSTEQKRNKVAGEVSLYTKRFVDL